LGCQLPDQWRENNATTSERKSFEQLAAGGAGFHGFAEG
jgi:hypothetical protein